MQSVSRCSSGMNTDSIFLAIAQLEKIFASPIDGELRQRGLWQSQPAALQQPLAQGARQIGHFADAELSALVNGAIELLPVVGLFTEGLKELAEIRRGQPQQFPLLNFHLDQ